MVGSSASKAFKTLGEAVQARLDGLLEHVGGLLESAGQALEGGLATVDTKLGELGEHATEKRLEQFCQLDVESISRLNDMFKALETSGVNVASSIVGALESIIEQVEATVQIVSSIRPVFDAAAAIG